MPASPHRAAHAVHVPAPDRGGRARPPTTAASTSYDYFAPGRSLALLSRPDPFAITRAPRGWSLPAATALSMRMGLFPPTGAPWGIAGSFDHDTPGIAPRRSAVLVDALLGLESTPAHTRLLELGAVRAWWLSTARGLEAPARRRRARTPCWPSPCACSAVPGARPRAYAVGAAVVAADDAEAPADHARPRLRPAPDGRARGTAPAPRGRRARVRLRPSASSTSARTASRSSAAITAPGYVVLADAWAPGWTARVDGREEPVVRARTSPSARWRCRRDATTVELRYRAPGLARRPRPQRAVARGPAGGGGTIEARAIRGRGHFMSRGAAGRARADLEGQARAAPRLLRLVRRPPVRGAGRVARASRSAPVPACSPSTRDARRPDLALGRHRPGPRPLERRGGRRPRLPFPRRRPPTPSWASTSSTTSRGRVRSSRRRPASCAPAGGWPSSSPG